MRPTAIKPLIPALALPLIGLALPALAQEAEAVATVAETVAPIVDKGDTTWMMLSAILVMAMTIPGLALFYGGLVRAKNMLSVLMQVLTIFCVMVLLWVCFGYSLAFTGAGSAEDATALTPFIGGLSKAFLSGVNTASLAETFTTNVFVPEYVFIIFQMAYIFAPGVKKKGFAGVFRISRFSGLVYAGHVELVFNGPGTKQGQPMGLTGYIGKSCGHQQNIGTRHTQLAIQFGKAHIVADGEPEATKR